MCSTSGNWRVSDWQTVFSRHHRASSTSCHEDHDTHELDRWRRARYRARAESLSHAGGLGALGLADVSVADRNVLERKLPADVPDQVWSRGRRAEGLQLPA